MVIGFGPEGADAGGCAEAEGRPEDIAKTKDPRFAERIAGDIVEIF